MERHEWTQQGLITLAWAGFPHICPGSAEGKMVGAMVTTVLSSIPGWFPRGTSAAHGPIRSTSPPEQIFHHLRECCVKSLAAGSHRCNTDTGRGIKPDGWRNLSYWRNKLAKDDSYWWTAVDFFLSVSQIFQELARSFVWDYESVRKVRNDIGKHRR